MSSSNLRSSWRSWTSWPTPKRVKVSVASNQFEHGRPSWRIRSGKQSWQCWQWNVPNLDFRTSCETTWNYDDFRLPGLKTWGILRVTPGDGSAPPQVNERAQQVVNQSLKTDALYEMLEQDGWTDGLRRLSHVESIWVYLESTERFCSLRAMHPTLERLIHSSFPTTQPSQIWS